MSTKPMTQAYVYLNDRQVGTLVYKDGYGSFNYEDLGPDHPILGLRFEYDPDYASQPAVTVPSWFANLLPERGSELRAAYSRQLGASDVPDFLLLIHLGNDLPGAVRVESTGNLPVQMAKALEKASTAQPGARMTFSLSGLQVKYSMHKTNDGFYLPSTGELGDWIVKLPGRSTLSMMPENEYAMMTWASAAGINVPEHQLTTGRSLHGLSDSQIGEDVTAYAIRRFDRTPTGRVHQEDFAQVLDVLPNQKDRGSHELIGEVLLNECPQDDFLEYIRRLTFCIISGNTDEHLKNWSLRYPDTRSARLSPAYDLVSATSYSQFRNSRLTLSIAGQNDTRFISLSDFRQFAHTLKANVDLVTEVVRQTVQQLKDTWPEVSDNTRTPDFIREHVGNRMQYLPLMRST